MGCANQGYVPLTSAVIVDQGLNKEISDGKHLHAEKAGKSSQKISTKPLQKDKKEKPSIHTTKQAEKLQNIKRHHARKKARHGKKKAKRLNWGKWPPGN